MNEFDAIAKYFRPLAKGAPGAFDLKDDAATICVPPGDELVLTCDAIICGTHFLDSDPIGTVARKLLRVNVSDLAAKGARPLGYLLSCLWSPGTTEAVIAEFASALGEDQARYALSLLGGDTTSGEGPLAFSLTALGLAPQGRMIKRSGARPGDIVYVTGTIGDVHLGLLAATDTLSLPDASARAFLVDRYRVPEPRLSFMLAARDYIHAAIDVSDGLIADAEHIATTSGVAIEIDAALVPLSTAGSAWIASGGDIARLASGGDDYEVCFAATIENTPALQAAAGATNTRLTAIGRVSAGSGVQLFGADGRDIAIARRGYTHF
jgi:thiamine-monophosphate kinase